MDDSIAAVLRPQTRLAPARTPWAERRNPATMVEADDLTADAVLCQAAAALRRSQLTSRRSFRVPADLSKPTARRICLEVRATLMRMRRLSSASVDTDDLTSKAARIQEPPALPRARRTP